MKTRTDGDQGGDHGGRLPGQWSAQDDQAICEHFLRHGGKRGGRMCYQFGYYRHAGWSRQAAAERVWQESGMEKDVREKRA